MLLLLNYSCQKDDTLSTNNETSDQLQNVISRKLSLQEIPHHTQVKKVLDNLKETLKRSSDGLQRSIEVDNVSILTTNVLYMTYANTHTYTFTLIRNNPEYYIENIVLHYNIITNSYDEYLVQYNVTAQNYIEIFDGGTLNESANVLVTNLDSGTLSTILGRSSCFTTCQTIYVPCSGSQSHEYGDMSCPLLISAPDQAWFSYQSCGLTCIDISPTTSIDQGPSSGGGGGGDPGDSDIITNPNPTEPCEEVSGEVGITDSNGCTPVTQTTQHQKNCEQLNILSSNLKIKQSFQDLQNKVADVFLTKEFGYKFTVGADPEPLASGNDLTQLKPEYGGQIYGMSHTHQDKLPSGDKVFPMFSAQDLFNLAMLAIKHSVHPKEFDLYVLTLTVKTDNGGTETFALKINDWTTFANWATKYGNDVSYRTKQNKSLHDKYEDIFENNGGNIPENYLKTFFEFLRINQINGTEQNNNPNGIDLYQANDPSLNSWKSLKLKNGSIIDENC